MKACPYCAEQIQDAAIKCRYCGRMLDGTEHPAPAIAGTGPSAPVFTHTGYRYVLGYRGDLYGIWDREDPREPAERFARTDQGWGEAWHRFAALEPLAAPVSGMPGGTVGPAAGTAASLTQPTSNGAIASLVLGIVGLVGSLFIVGAVLSILAVVFGASARGEIGRSPVPPRGRGMATAGLVLGWIGIALGVAVAVVVSVQISNGTLKP